ncbi:kinase-like domain-containing protein [Jimgerdemannia flammicorona]|uniref:Kinase-like domain-containing protein n=1 Tax=Jimgerdemannia flammicorona TaxID=994334 RepID=A0A433QHJ0_9FUNG|nr:kinase-like domain-containing protein [Jimgerdemannia flammicorona]
MARQARLPQLNSGTLVVGVVVGELIRKGRNSTTYKAKASNGTVFSLKVVQRDGCVADNQCDNLPSIQHLNIGRVIRRHEDKNTIYLLMEPVNGSLYSRFMSAPKEGESQAVVDDIDTQMNIKAAFSQVFDVLSYLHGRGIYHHNLKPQNIFYTIRPDNTLQVKLFDFDFAVAVCPGYLAPLATLQIRAREELEACVSYRQQRSDMEKADVWSLGISLYQVLMNQARLPGGEQAIADEVFNDGSAFQQNCTPDFSEFMRGILHPKVEQRWSLAKARAAFTHIQAFWLPRVTEDEVEMETEWESECESEWEELGARVDLSMCYRARHIGVDCQ